MAGKESYFWHKLHSLTGIVPVGYYMVQHLTLNSFTLASPEKFNGVVEWFGNLPAHVLWSLKIGGIWIPLIFHAVYGLFISSRGLPNVSGPAYKYRENWMYTLQRVTGIAAFIFLIYHVATTSIYATRVGHEVIKYAAWQEKLTANGYILLFVYALGVLACTYHLSYGIWNFCIRWGITIGEKSQQRMIRFSAATFVALTLLGWGALAGFLIHDVEESATVEGKQPPVSVSYTQ